MSGLGWWLSQPDLGDTVRKPTFHEKVYFKIHKRWPQSYVDARLAEDDAKRAKYVDPPPRPFRGSFDGHENSLEYIPAGNYVGKVVHVGHHTTMTGRHCWRVEVEVQDLVYEHHRLFSFHLKPTEDNYERTRWVYENVWFEITPGIVGDVCMLKVTEDKFQDRTVNRVSYAPIPDHNWQFDMQFSTVGSSPTTGSHSPVVTEAMRAAVEEAQRVLREKGFIVTNTGYGSLSIGPTESSSLPQ